MIFDSLGIGEIGVIFALMILLVEPKKVGHYLKKINDFKKKVTRFQGDVKQHINTLVVAEEQKEKVITVKQSKAETRTEAIAKIRTITAFEKHEAAAQVLDKLKALPDYQNAKVIAAFVGSLEEIDTEHILQMILQDQKKLMLPFIRVQGEETSMDMAIITDLNKDLIEGHFSIQEPAPSLWPAAHESSESPDLILIPGSCFDLQGGRLGKGKGFYDRYLSQRAGFKIGLCFDVQIVDKKLPLEPHDQGMDMILSEKRSLIFSRQSSFQ